MLGLQRIPRSTTLQLFRKIVVGGVFKVRSSTVTAPNEGAAESEEGSEQSVEDPNRRKIKGSLVAAAFHSLQEETNKNSSKKSKIQEQIKSNEMSINEKILNARTVNGLLAVTEINSQLSRKHALKIVSILAEWSTMKKVKLSEFENDARFLKICRLLGRTVPKNGSTEVANGNKKISGFRTDDLNTVLGVAGDDEAAKLIASISLSQMVKVMSTLAQRKRRSTPLLRSLAFNISSSTDPLDIKQCADVLFAMSSLNFQDSVLSAKLCADINMCLTKKIDKSAVIGSIMTSLGILKYRDLDVLEALTQWLLKNHEICRPQDLTSYIFSSAMLNFKSANLVDVEAKLIKPLVQEDFARKMEWLNHIWALSVLGSVSNEQLSEILSEDFIKTLEEHKMLTPAAKMRILNLNGYAKHVASNYSGSFLRDDSIVFDVPMAHIKSKQVLIKGMLDALKSLLPKEEHVQSLVDSKMGFLIDATCNFDSKRNPLPFDRISPDSNRIALMVIDYHDVCQGTHRCASGVTNLHFDLLEKSGYKILPIPFNEFNTSDKLLKRVQYLDSKFKALINKTI